MSERSHASLDELFDRYRVFLIDAYGVLVNSSGSLPGACEFIARLEREGREYYILTNDASRLPESARDFYARHGLRIPLERIFTAGMAVGEAFRQAGMDRPACAVLGTADSLELVRRAGGFIVEITPDADYEAVIVADDSGFDTLPTLNALLTSFHRLLLRGKTPKLFLPNPDLLYPRGSDAFGFTSGAMARLFELGLERLHPELALKFTPLGKPETFLFEMGLRRSGGARETTVMLGDQLTTDVCGANRAGIASVLVGGGLTRLPLPANLAPELTPTHVLESLIVTRAQ